MEVEQNFSQLKGFYHEDTAKAVDFVETIAVQDGVECDVYSFADDSTKDLGIIRISKGKQTPLQKVLQGDKTVEGYISGKGRLLIRRADGTEESYEVGSLPFENFAINVEIGDIMQWQASQDSALIAYEICYPPYASGRYENIG